MCMVNRVQGGPVVNGAPRDAYKVPKIGIRVYRVWCRVYIGCRVDTVCLVNRV